VVNYSLSFLSAREGIHTFIPSNNILNEADIIYLYIAISNFIVSLIVYGIVKQDQYHPQ